MLPSARFIVPMVPEMSDPAEILAVLETVYGGQNPAHEPVQLLTPDVSAL
jgi:hypothetical protein